MFARRKDSLACASLAVMFLLIRVCARPEYSGDPLSYAGEAYAFLQRRGLVETRGILEFGHLIWRPMAAAGAALCSLVLGRLSGIEPKLVPLVVMIALNAIFTLLAVLLVYRITRSLSGSVTISTAVAFLFLTANSVLTYLPSGYPYLPGAAMQLFAVSLIVAPPAKIRSLRLRALLLGIALSVSVCLWAPFAVSVPGIIALSFLWRGREVAPLERARLALQTSVWVMLATGFTFGAAILLNHFQSLAEVAQWIRNSSHEWAQTHRLLRLATGLPRSLVTVQEESLLLKRLYFHDPYASVSWSRILTSVAWKPPVFALAIGALAWRLSRTMAGRRLLLANLCGWIPLVVFSVVVFEPSSPERFLPGFAMLFAGLAYVAGTTSWRDSASWVLGASFAAMLAVNLASVMPGAAGVSDRNAEQRLNAMRQVWRPNSLIVLLSYRDAIFKFHFVQPFNPLSRVPFQFLDAIEPGTLRSFRFRQEFSTAALNTWDRGGEVWISQRLIAERPRPEWEWVEGDIPGVPWRELAGYYRCFQTDAVTGSSDGFLRLSANATNRLALAAQIPPCWQERTSLRN